MRLQLVTGYYLLWNAGCLHRETGDLTVDNDKHHRRVNQSDDRSVNYHQLILIVSDDYTPSLLEAGRLMHSGNVSTFVF